MYTVQIIYDPKSAERAEFQLRGNIKDLQTQLTQLGYQTRDVMRNTIGYKVKRGGTGRLAQAIDTEVDDLGNTFSVGVGNIDTLNREAEYWYVVNYGKRYDTGVPFVPGGIKPVNKNLPVHTPGRSTVFRTAKANVGFKPIQPMNFIETTLSWLSGQLSTLSVR